MANESIHPPQAAEPLSAASRQGLYEAIYGRRDIRHFLSDPIPVEVLARILTAAHHAGSVGFMQPWDFLIIRDAATRRAIRDHVEAQRLIAARDFEGERREKYLSFKLEGILDSALNVCITCDPTRAGPNVIGRHTIRETDAYSTCGAVQNFWLAARAEGIGVGWVSILEPSELRRLLGLPDHLIPVAYLCVGYVRDFPERPTFETAGWRPRLSLTDLVHGERLDQPASPELIEAIKAEMAKIDGIRTGRE